MSQEASVALIATALFALGAGIIGAFGNAAARPGSAELWRHFGATILIAAAVLVPAAAHPVLFATLAALAAWRCSFELADLQRLRVTPLRHLGVAAAALAAVALARDPVVLMTLSAALVVVAAPVYARAMRGAIDGIARWIFALALPLLAAAHLARLVHLDHGFLWIAFVYGVVEVQDSMAFLVGKLLGRRPLAPRLSPRKTIEGASAGALAGTAVGTLIGALLLALPWSAALALAIAAAAAGFAGDLFASALKRGAAVKDFRPVHGRHGGLLDIYDSTFAAAIVLSAALWALGMP